MDQDDEKRSTLKVEAGVVQLLAHPEGQATRESQGAPKRAPVTAGSAKRAVAPARPGGLDTHQGLQNFPPELDDLPF